MSTLNQRQQQAIETLVTPARVSFDATTRERFSRDAGVQPRVPVLGGRTLPDAVVWPEEEWEIASLVEFGVANGLGLVPRGGGTGVYGGAVPSRGGIVVDLSRLEGVVAVDREEALVTVRAGTRWTDVESQLHQYGLATCVYPTSAPTSTVAGWLAQGGAGLGSHAFGWIEDNVESIRVVGSDGQVHHLEGYDLDTVAGAEGTTGIITEVVLRVRPRSTTTCALLELPDAASLDDALRLIGTWELPIWSAGFVNAAACTRLQRARGLKEAEWSALQQPMNDGFVLQLVYDVADAERISAALHQLEVQIKARQRSEELAKWEWANQFKPLRWTFVAGTAAPAEAVVPLYNLERVLRRLARSIGPDVLIEGTSVDGWQTVLRVFSPGASDGAGFDLALEVAAIAERHGGHAYSTGRYLGARANSVLGKHRVQFLRNARAWLDPAEAMNPGKVVFGNALVGHALQAKVGLNRLTRHMFGG
jgi:FAD/FMN-containing dehydrogenase